MINSKHPWGFGLPLVAVSLSLGPLSDQIPTLSSSQGLRDEFQSKGAICYIKHTFTAKIRINGTVTT